MATVHKSPGSSLTQSSVRWFRIQMLLFIAAVFVLHGAWRATWKHPLDIYSKKKDPLDHPMGQGARKPDALHLHGAKTGGPSLCHGMRPPSLRREDEPHHSCQTVTAQDLCSVFRYGHHLLLEPKEWCCQLSCNLICTKILRTGKRNSPTQRNIIIFSFFLNLKAGT